MTRVEHCTEAYLRNRIAELEARVAELTAPTLPMRGEGSTHITFDPLFGDGSMLDATRGAVQAHEPDCEMGKRPECWGDGLRDLPYDEHRIRNEDRMDCTRCGLQCSCAALRAAYQRGREDAAEAVQRVRDLHDWITTDEAIEHVRIQERQQAAVRVNAALHKYLLDGCASPNACRAAVDACRDAS